MTGVGNCDCSDTTGAVTCVRQTRDSGTSTGSGAFVPLGNYDQQWPYTPEVGERLYATFGATSIAVSVPLSAVNK